MKKHLLWQVLIGLLAIVFVARLSAAPFQSIEEAKKERRLVFYVIRGLRAILEIL